jgi:ketosteroid isomerase-like protein
MLNQTLTVALFLTLVTPLGAQDRSADEKAIRAEVGKLEAGRGSEVKQTDDSVFWSGAYVRPVVGREKPVLRPGSSADGKRINAKMTIKVNQIRVSDSGDMAYEYSTARSSWDRTDNKQHIEFDAAVLRVWRKENGQWKIAAFFTRPIEDTPTTR